MDYFGVLKRAWEVTWKYKALWVLGFFAAAASGGSGGSSGGSMPSNTSSWQTDAPMQFDQASEWFAGAIALIIAISLLMLLVLMVFMVLSVAARGGLIHEVNQAEERGQVSLKRGWGVGFHYFWRTFGIGFLLALPFIIFVMVFVFLMVGIAFSMGAGLDAGSGPAIGGFVISMICGIGLFVLLMIPAAVIFGILNELAVRYGVLMDVRAIDAIKRSWADLWGKRGSFVMWLVMLLPGMAYGVVMMLVSMVFIIPAMFMMFGEIWFGAIALLFLLGIVMIAPTAAFNTFVSASWTVFFRRMTGMEVVEQPTWQEPDPAHTEGGFIPPPPPSPTPPA